MVPCRKALRLFVLILVCGVGSAVAAAQQVVTVSPGQLHRSSLVQGMSPTFSWGAVSKARHYELIVYAVEDDGLAFDQPVLSVRLPGSATSWTPDAEDGLTPGMSYAWFIRADVGGRATEWSRARRFELSKSPTPAEVASALDVLRRYGASRDSSVGEGANRAVVGDRTSTAASIEETPAEVPDKAARSPLLTPQFAVSKTGDVVGSSFTGSFAGDGAGLFNLPAASDLICVGCVGSTDLATGSVASIDVLDNSISGVDILNSSITGADVATSSLDATDIQDEPGVASIIAAAGMGIEPGSGVTVLASRTISVPASGFVLVIASGQFRLDHTTGLESQITLGVSDTSTSFPSNQDVIQEIPSSAPSGSYTIPGTCHGLFQVAAGSRTFYFLGRRDSGIGHDIADIQLSLIYFSTSRGTVTPTALPPTVEDLLTAGLCADGRPPDEESCRVDR